MIIDHPDRPPHGLALVIEKARQQVDRLAGRFAGGAERHEDHLVATVRFAVPGAVLTNEYPLLERWRQYAGFGKGQAQ
ncbi:hypothetical protein D3C77_407000 [compost metagenome]